MKMPALGESVTEGTVTRWLKQVGDTIEVDEPLLEVSTDKVDTEIPSPVAGTVLEIKVAEDETADVGAELAIIGSADSAPAAAPAPQQAPAPAAGRRAEAGGPQPEPKQAPSRPRSRRSSPRRRRRLRAVRRVVRPAAPAAEPAAAGRGQRRRPPRPAAPARRTAPATPGTSPRWCASWPPRTASTCPSLTGTGVGGRIRKQDVLEAAEKAAAAKAGAGADSRPPAAPRPAAGAPKPAPSPLRGRTEKLTRTRATIARRMVESLQISAQLTTVVEVDVTRIAQLRQRRPRTTSWPSTA